MCLLTQEEMMFGLEEGQKITWLNKDGHQTLVLIFERYFIEENSGVLHAGLSNPTTGHYMWPLYNPNTNTIREEYVNGNYLVDET
jgi:hypothetical protein